MMSTIFQIKRDAQSALREAKNATYMVNPHNEFSDEQEKAIGTAFFHLKRSRDELSRYGSNPLKRLIRWLVCGSIDLKVKRVYQRVLPYCLVEKTREEIVLHCKKMTKKALDGYEGKQFEACKLALEQFMIETESLINRMMPTLWKNYDAYCLDSMGNKSNLDGAFDSILKEFSKSFDLLFEKHLLNFFPKRY